MTDISNTKFPIIGNYTLEFQSSTRDVFYAKNKAFYGMAATFEETKVKNEKNYNFLAIQATINLIEKISADLLLRKSKLKLPMRNTRGVCEIDKSILYNICNILRFSIIF